MAEAAAFSPRIAELLAAIGQLPEPIARPVPMAAGFVAGRLVRHEKISMAQHGAPWRGMSLASWGSDA
jgi:hypothetical protein